MLAQSMATEVAAARSLTLGDTLRRTAARYPAKVALIDGDTSLTYEEFNTRVNQLANALTQRGIVKGDRVTMLSKNCWQFLVASYATAKIGAIFTPINFMLKVDEVSYLLEDSRPAACIAQTGFTETMRRALEQSGITPAVRIEITVGQAASPEWQPFDVFSTAASSAEPTAMIGDDDALRLMYTSGTESKPKGLLHSSRSLIAEYVSSIIDGGMSHDDIDLHSLPFYHCAQLDCFIGPDVYLGATSIILPGPDSARVLATIERYKVTKYFAPPTVWIALLNSQSFAIADLSSMKKGYYGASPMPVEVLKKLLAELPDLDFWNFYGQTELAPVATILPPHEQVSHAGSAGRPVLNVETAIMAEDGTILPRGEVGEIVHRGPQIALGYWNRDELTAEAFKYGWFHSGDLGVFDAEGRLTIVDRVKDMIKTGGENVASREVEEALYGHPAVAEVAVFATPHEKWIETVAAAVVVREGHEVTAEELQAFACERLATYKVPTVVRFYEALPKNPSGKIMKRDLREAFSE
ncbi:long-chain-fatty-acid--CoA ligase [Leucobacter sp. UCMA 4100]|uniref:fatty acyl-CoA synthetase n=1 Tax=Leucobacter sp. UCMA 4100 TaxID=2810534 RepID=UPI0022EB189F|nr:fatty acyl-CoA synthetase [Leucobacter sp. UCMA 4100]MDA3148244.1 long-chain-fatty-acid--CoA ligase [Leucobacter sp. UCMA 4100]